MAYDPKLTNIDNCLYYDDNGNVAIRTGIRGGSVTISGPVSVPGTITVQSTPELPVHTHVTEIGTSGILSVTNNSGINVGTTGQGALTVVSNEFHLDNTLNICQIQTLF